MKPIVPALLIVGLLAVTGGCVAQQHADNQHETIRAYKERVTELESKIDELNQRIALMQDSGDDTSATVLSLTNERDALQQQLDKLLKENEQLKVDLAQARAASVGKPLPIEVENELKAFARQYPNLAEYDPVSGAVKFASDLTFALGSDNVSAKATQALGKLAEVFNSPEAGDYGVRIVGHTDTVPISRPATRQKHPTNWHLSVHRAISVRDALAKAGINDLRLSVAGHGPYRPTVQNTRRGAEPNRRVEIYLVPMAPVNEQYLTPTGAGGETNNNAGGNSANGDGDGDGDEAPAPGAMFK